MSRPEGSGLGSGSGSGWLDRLPRLLRDLLGEWELEVDGASRDGSTAVVVPVRTRAGRPAALKVSRPHPEAAFEHLALQHWNPDGQGPCVQLLTADPRRFALLLERADAGHDLTTISAVEACTVVAGLYAELHRPAVPQLRLLSDLTREWIERLEALETRRDVPRRYVTEALSYARGFVDDPRTDGTLLHTDLHYDHVLAADRRPWLVIAPAPVSGDPHFEPGPLLSHRWDEVLAAPKAREEILDRFYAVIDTAGLDEDRARAWVVVRAVVAIADAVDAPQGAETISTALTLLKAIHV